MKSDVDCLAEETSGKLVILWFCFSLMKFLNNKFLKLFLEPDWLVVVAVVVLKATGHVDS